MLSLFVFLSCEKGAHVAQAGLEISELIPLPPRIYKCWDCRCAPLHAFYGVLGRGSKASWMPGRLSAS